MEVERARTPEHVLGLLAPNVTGTAGSSATSVSQELDASPEEYAAARASAEELVAETMPAFASRVDDVLITLPDLCLVDLITRTGLSVNNNDLNPDPMLSVPNRVLRRYFTRSCARAAQQEPTSASTAQSTSHAAPQVAGVKRKYRAVSENAKADTKRAKSAAHDRGRTSRGSVAELRPPRIAYEQCTVNQQGAALHLAQNRSVLDDFDFYPVHFTRSLLTYDAAKAAATPRAQLQPLPKPNPVMKRRNPRSIDAARTARRNAQRQTVVLTPTLPLDAPATSSALPDLQDLNVAKSGNCGSVPRWKRDAVRAAYDTHGLLDLLSDFRIVPYDAENDADLAICDRSGRCVAFRTKVVADIKPGEGLIHKLSHDLRLFSQHCPIPPRDRSSNIRGDHFFGCMGVHRQYAAEPYETAFHRKYRENIAWLMRPDGPLSRYTCILTSIIESRFPNMAKRMKDNASWHQARSAPGAEPLKPHFGLFWNCCVNVPSPEVGVNRCLTVPHSDSRNVAALFCALMAYWADGLVGEDEWSWIVLWELGVILQCPRGAFVFYPSALLLHFNVRIVKCKKGEHPTPENSQEIPLSGPGGRGSVVWFSQATMYSMTTEGQDGRAHAARVEEYFPVVIEGDRLDDVLL